MAAIAIPTITGCEVVNDGRQCTKVAGHSGSCRFIGIRASTKIARTHVVMPDGTDVGRVALIMSALSALAALPVELSPTFWWSDYPEGEAAFRAWAATNPAYEIVESGTGRSVDIVRLADYTRVASFRRDLARHQIHPLAPDRFEIRSGS